MSAGPDFFYEGGGRRAALDALFGHVHANKGVVALTGLSGSGRTALIHRFQAEADPDVLAIAAITGDILMSADQCLSELSRALLPDAFRSGAAPALEDAIQVIRESGRQPVLIVDDAHELGEQPRRVVAEFCHGNQVPLVLAGDAALVADAAAAVTLPALSGEESEDFIAAWLAVGDEDELPSHRTVERLHRESAGLPGNLVKLLAAGAATRNAWFPGGLPFWHLFFAGVAAVLLLWLLSHLTASTPAAAPEAGGEIAVPLPSPGEHATAVAADVPGTRLSSVAVPRPVVATEVPDRPGEQTLSLPPPSAPAAVSAPAPVPAAAPVPVVPPAPAAVSGPAPQPAAPAVRRFTADEGALLKEKASRYTLQLFASFNERAVRDFAARHPGVGIRMFRTLREDLPWYVAVTGVYGSKEEAKAAVARLPADLRKLQPWARSLQGIQDELRRRKD